MIEIVGIPIDNTVAACDTTVLFLQLLGGAFVITIFPIWLSTCMIHGIVKMVRSWSGKVVKVKQSEGG